MMCQWRQYNRHSWTAVCTGI